MSGTRQQRHSLEREVHVWLTRPATITDLGTLERCCAMLNQEELSRMEQLRTDALQHLFLISHALVRATLSRYEPVPPEAWRFSKGEHGRPEISEPVKQPRLRFNLSHTAGLAAVVVALEWDCGVDVERSGRVRRLDAVARRVFTQTEQDDLAAQPNDEARHGRFTDYWALKEAYIKARGMGFQLAPRRFGIELHPTQELAVQFGSDMGDQRAAEWQLHLQKVGEGMRLGVCLHRGESPEREVIVRETVPGETT